jgi:DNA-binding NarL/FixJ family response regulator
VVLAMRIFIVEDSDIVQSILIEELGRIQGVQVCGMTGDTRDAVPMILESAPDLVILDIVLQNGNGFEVLKKIRKEGSDCFVIVLTNHPYHHYREISKELGADLFFDKTIEFEKAIEAVRIMACN